MGAHKKTKSARKDTEIAVSGPGKHETEGKCGQMNLAARCPARENK